MGAFSRPGSGGLADDGVADFVVDRFEAEARGEGAARSRVRRPPWSKGEEWQQGHRKCFHNCFGSRSARAEVMRGSDVTGYGTGARCGWRGS